MMTLEMQLMIRMMKTTRKMQRKVNLKNYTVKKSTIKMKLRTMIIIPISTSTGACPKVTRTRWRNKATSLKK